MDQSTLTNNPFAVLTFIVAPALLTNTSSVLALSTINRMLRTRDRMHELFTKSDSEPMSDSERTLYISQVNRVEKQAVLLLRALHSIYIALGSFAGATLMTLLGAALARFHNESWFGYLGWTGLALGFLGVSGLGFGCVMLFTATQLSLVNIREEAAHIRERQRARIHPG
jgi:hypothetical protein